MKYKLASALAVLVLLGCSEPENNTADPALDSIEIPDGIQSASQSDQKRIYEDFPNAKTTTLNIVANEPQIDLEPIKSFRARLKKDQFKLSETQTEQVWSTYDCHLNRIIRVTGKGIQAYRASSRVGIGAKKDYFPDFIMTVMHFKTSQEADTYFDIFAVPVNSHDFCNGKTPEKIVKNGRTIFYFATRAEMFRGYINQYAEFIQQQKTVPE